MVPPSLCDRIEIGTCHLHQKEVSTFNMALGILDRQFKKDGIYPSKLPTIRCQFIDVDFVDIGFEMDSVFGTLFLLIFYRMNRIREYIDLNPCYLLWVYLEELCHYYYNISDEILVKVKVLTMIQEFQPDHYPNALYIAKEYGIN